MHGERTPVVVLASGGGTLAQSVLDAAADPECPFVVTGLVSDRRCEALDRAEAAGVPATVVAPADHADRSDWDASLAEAVAAGGPEWVASAGFMRILGPRFLSRFPDRVLNTHPALLPSFPGAHGVRDALAHGVAVTGTTCHVVDAGVDTGPIITQRAVAVEDDDTEESLHERIKVQEREMLVDVGFTVRHTRGIAFSPASGFTLSDSRTLNYLVTATRA